MKGAGQLRTPLVEGRLLLARNFADEYGYKFLFVESNLHLIINKYVSYSHIGHHTFMGLFCIHLLQPCIRCYYYSSGYAYNQFCLNADALASFDLLSMFCASIGDMKLYSAGTEKSRLEKVRALLDYEPARKYLNVCVNEVKNDGTCFKCIRTMLTLDALGGIDKFSKVFDVETYKRNRFFYLKRLYLDAKFRNDPYLREILPYFKHELTFFLKLRFFLSAGLNRIKTIFK